MKNVNLESLIDKNSYQVFVLSSPSPIPLSFARHTWFVVNKMGTLDRYEIFHKKDAKSPNPECINNGYMYKNYFPPFQGIEMFFYNETKFWNARLEFELAGEQDLIKKVIEVIENSFTNYPYTNKYNLLGPNSNSYPMWILNKFPEIKVRLPHNAIGRNFFKGK
jgi:hypothetical protein